MPMKSIFSRHRIPEVIMSDNGPQFDRHEFKTFAREYGFKPITLSRYPHSNGFVENGMKIVKQLSKGHSLRCRSAFGYSELENNTNGSCRETMWQAVENKTP